MEMTVGERIRKMRKGKMTQAELAYAIGVHEITIRRWELGERTPDIEDLQKIANVFEIPVGELLGEIEIEPSKDSSFRKTANLLVYERNGERLELPATQESYEIFREIARRISERGTAQSVLP